MTSEDQAGFSLKGATGGKFTDVFGSLDTIEAKHNAEEKVRVSTGEKPSHYWKQTDLVHDVIDAGNTSRKAGFLDRHGDHEESSKEKRPEKVNKSCYGPHYRPRFKKPIVPSQKSSVPGYKVNPDKWKCYSLSDVDNSQMSERANTSAALSFLNDLKKQHSQENANSPEDQGKVVFKKPKLSKTSDILQSVESDSKDASEVGASIGGKVIMPEYNFGTKRHKEGHKKAKQGKRSAGDRVSLGHLNEESDTMDMSDCGVDSANLDVVVNNDDKLTSSVSVERHVFKSKSKKKRTIREKEETEEDHGD